MSKYIIKNCPAYQTFYSDTTNGGSSTVCTKGYIKGYCQDCTDCVVKQIVELCRHYKKHSDCGRDCSSFGMFLSKLLGKLDIEETE